MFIMILERSSLIPFSSIRSAISLGPLTYTHQSYITEHVMEIKKREGEMENNKCQVMLRDEYFWRDAGAHTQKNCSKSGKIFLKEVSYAREGLMQFI